LGFLLFVAYGSLVPLDFHSKPLAVAWQEFLNIPYLEIALKHREDFVANILLYIPIGMCLTGALGPPSGRFRLGVGLAVFVMAVTAGTAIEFAQLFFPPRTVSVNDIAANVVGTAIGVAMWWLAGQRVGNLVVEVQHGGPVAIRAAMIIYILAYLGLSLFPFDFLLTPGEIQWKLDSSGYDLLFVSGSCTGALRCGVKLMAEVAAAAPLGVLVCMLRPRRTEGIYLLALVGGCLLGAAIEVAQFFIVTGISQGASVLTRGIGLVLGVAVYRAFSVERFERARPYLRLAVVLGAAPYLLLVVSLNRWFSAPWTDSATALAALGRVNFIPFYYHYYTTETAALHSLLQIATLYSLIGLAYWMWRAGQKRPWQDDPWIPAGIAAALALLVEAGKLFVPDQHPDPTDVLIAACSSFLAYTVATAILRWTVVAPQPAGAAAQPQRRVSEAEGKSASELSTLWCVPLFIAVAVLLVAHPFGARLTAFLGAYALLVWRWPRAALPAILALLPVLDLAPWSGWFFFDEFDAVLMVTLALLLWRLPPESWKALGAGAGVWVIALLAVSYGVSALVGVLPLQPLDANSFASYYSHYNSLRTLKGFVWAMIFAGPVAAQLNQGRAGQVPLVAGMLAGLIGVVAFAILERQAFVGLFDFSTDHRITSTFSAMHTGGAFIEGYLVMAIPFLALWFHLRRGVVGYLAGAVLFVLATYALMVTFARGGYLGYAGALAVVGIAAIAHKQLGHLRSARSALVAALLIGVGCAVAFPVMEGSYMRARWSGVDQDAGARLRHWRSALAMMDDGALTAAFGMGLGRFPETYLYRNASGEAPATYRYARDAGGAFLILGGGDGLYFGQRVPLESHRTYVMQLDVRSHSAGATLNVAICEKSLLYSHGCQWLAIPPSAVEENWKHYQLSLDSGEIGAGAWSGRPVELALTNSKAGTVVDVRNVRLLDPDGRDLIRNGNFSDGNSYWFFSSDNHLAWHTKNLAVQILFEQGLFGLAAFVLAVGCGLTKLATSMFRGDLFSGVLLASLVGFLLVGLFDSLFDAPRLTLIFFLWLFVSMAGSGQRSSSPAMSR
jgi:VanZ family protein/O-antigen ligase